MGGLGRGCTAEAGNMAAPVCGDLGGLFTWFGTLDAALASDDRRVLLALDEYENLDRKLGESVFPRDLPTRSGNRSSGTGGSPGSSPGAMPCPSWSMPSGRPGS